MLALSTQLHNQTDLPIGFDVGRRGCALPRLRAGNTRSVKLSQILRCCRPPAKSNWQIRVLIDGKFRGILLHPIHDVISMTRIIFKYEHIENDYVFSVEGVREKRGVAAVADYLRRLRVVGIGPVFGRNSSWSKRSVVRIAQVNLRDQTEDQNPFVVRHDNNSLPLRLREGAQVSAGSSTAAASPPQEESNREASAGSTARAAASPPQEEGNSEISAATSESVINSGESKRIYQLLALRRKHNSTYLILFCLAFAIVALTRFFISNNSIYISPINQFLV